jgi:hypothetical protein
MITAAIMHPPLKAIVPERKIIARKKLKRFGFYRLAVLPCDLAGIVPTGGPLRRSFRLA